MLEIRVRVFEKVFESESFEKFFPFFNFKSDFQPRIKRDFDPFQLLLFCEIKLRGMSISSDISIRIQFKNSSNPSPPPSRFVSLSDSNWSQRSAGYSNEVPATRKKKKKEKMEREEEERRCESICERRVSSSLGALGSLCENGMPGNDTEGDTYLPPRWSPTRGSPRDREKRKFWPRLHLVPVQPPIHHSNLSHGLASLAPPATYASGKRETERSLARSRNACAGRCTRGKKLKSSPPS